MSSTPPKISVIIPVYNGLPFIRRTLQSVLGQEYRPHEIIVINDGSTDGTLAILDEFKDRLIIKSIPNGGVANARNEGIKLATGEYVAFLDADDVWFRGKLKTVAEYVQKYPEIGFFCSDYAVRFKELGFRMIPHSRVVKGKKEINPGAPLRTDPLKLLLRENFVGTPSAVVVKKKVAEEAGFFDPSCKIVEDLDFYLRAALWTNFVVIRDILLYKKDHEANMSAKKLSLYAGHKRVLQHFCASNSSCIKARGFGQKVGLALAELDYILGNIHFEEDKRKEAFRLYFSALSQSWEPVNFLKFFWTVSKKSIRLLTFGFVSWKKLKASSFK